MEWFFLVYEYMMQSYGVLGLALLGLLVVMFLIQLRYWIGLYGRIPAYRDSSRNSDVHPAVSVILVFHQPDFSFIENVLPVMLSQEYDDFEIVVTDVSGDVEFGNALTSITEHNDHFSVVKMINNRRFPISDKMALNIAIKSARYENIITTTPDSCPVSNQWIARMARGFIGAEVVFGYCGMEPEKGIVNRIIRVGRAGLAVRWLSAAMRGKPYRGTIHNLGFSKRLYFENGGFNYLNLNIGEDDLFIQKLIANADVAVVVSANSLVRQKVWGGLDWWYSDRKLFSNAFKYYPGRVKRYIGCELWSRFLFFMLVIASLIVSPFEGQLFVGGLFVLRFLLVHFEMRRISRRLSESGILRVVAIYDIAEPFYEAILAIDRTLKRSPGLWR